MFSIYQLNYYIKEYFPELIFINNVSSEEDIKNSEKRILNELKNN